MNILVTNDDGFFSPGLTDLAGALAPLGSVTAVAPDREMSGVSHSLTLHHPLRIRAVGDSAFAVDGTPADCVNLAVNGMLDGWKPDVVIAGVNRGANVGSDIAYSGTVAAAEEGAILRLPSMAVSLDTRGDGHFESAIRAAVDLLPVAMERCRGGLFFNVNVPNVAQGQIRGYRWTRLGRRIYNDALVRRTDPRGQHYFWIGGEEPESESIPDSDAAALLEGYVSVTPIHVDRTDEASLARLRDVPLPG